MTQQQRDQVHTVWPVVTLAVAVIGAITVLTLFAPADNPQARTVIQTLMMAVGPLLAAAYVTEKIKVHVRDQIEPVKREVNGRMSELIARVPEQPGGRHAATEPAPGTMGAV